MGRNNQQRRAAKKRARQTSSRRSHARRAAERLGGAPHDPAALESLVWLAAHCRRAPSGRLTWLSCSVPVDPRPTPRAGIAAAAVLSDPVVRGHATRSDRWAAQLQGVADLDVQPSPMDFVLGRRPSA